MLLSLNTTNSNVRREFLKIKKSLQTGGLYLEVIRYSKLSLTTVIRSIWVKVSFTRGPK